MLRKRREVSPFFNKLFELVGGRVGRVNQANLELDARKVFRRMKACTLDNSDSQKKLGIKLRRKKSGVAQGGIK
jgi:hypothetical protein